MEIYYEALRKGQYTSYISEGTYMDPTAAIEELGFTSNYDIEKMTTDMLEKLQQKLRQDVS